MLPRRAAFQLTDLLARGLLGVSLIAVLPACGDPAPIESGVTSEAGSSPSAPVEEPISPPEEATGEPEPQAQALPDLSDWFVSEGHLGLHTLAWRPLGGHDEIPRNIEFSAQALLLRDGLPVPGAFLQVTGFMPAHGHGMVQLPQAEEVGDGRYRIDGMLLHMRGAWQVRFSVIVEGTVETVTYEFEL